MNVNILINCAANVELEAKLDMAVRVNVSGPLQLLRLLQESENRLCFVQVSSTFVNADKKGFVEEAFLPSDTNWLSQYEKILSLPPRELKEKQSEIIGNFPDAYHYSKRMTEELMRHFNKDQNLPLCFIRPSIVATAANEPLPGWTDSTGLMQGTGLLVGLGIFRDIIGNP